MRSPRLLLLPVMLVVAGCGTWVSTPVEPQEAQAVPAAHEEPCADAEDFTCVTLTVPTDHFVADSPTWDVTFAVRRADQESRGVFVTATGGPGSSGIAVAEGYTEAMPSEITDSYDLVFFDQRGIGLSQPFRCDDTYLNTFYETVDSSSPAADRDAYAQAAETFGRACFAEAGVGLDDARRYGTRQAVEDLEDFRRYLGVDTMTLYGESYGTQYVQTYAAAHPDHVDGVVLDGVVDLTTSAQDFYTESARAYSDALVATLQACDEQRRCADDAPGDSLAAYDQLVEQLTVDPAELEDGEEIGADWLRGVASGSVSDPYSRTEFQEALNDALNGDFESLAALGGSGPPDDSFSQALFYAVECQDYDFVGQGSDGRAELDAWLDTGAAAGVDQLRLGDNYYGDLPCLFWPGVADSPDFDRPAPVTDPPYPVFVLTANTDPNTPTQNALRVYGRIADDASLLTLEGGPHVVFGRGDSCVDDPVAAFVADHTPPATEVTICEGDVSVPY